MAKPKFVIQMTLILFLHYCFSCAVGFILFRHLPSTHWFFPLLLSMAAVLVAGIIHATNRLSNPRSLCILILNGISSGFVFAAYFQYLGPAYSSRVISMDGLSLFLVGAALFCFVCKRARWIKGLGILAALSVIIMGYYSLPLRVSLSAHLPMGFLWSVYLVVLYALAAKDFPLTSRRALGKLATISYGLYAAVGLAVVAVLMAAAGDCDCDCCDFGECCECCDLDFSKGKRGKR